MGNYLRQPHFSLLILVLGIGKHYGTGKKLCETIGDALWVSRPAFFLIQRYTAFLCVQGKNLYSHFYLQPFVKSLKAKYNNENSCTLMSYKHMPVYVYAPFKCFKWKFASRNDSISLYNCLVDSCYANQENKQQQRSVCVELCVVLCVVMRFLSHFFILIINNNDVQLSCVFEKKIKKIGNLNKFTRFLPSMHSHTRNK